MFNKVGMKIALPSLTVNYVPTEEEIKKCYDFGKEFAKNIIAS
jgi:flavorubredoxin